MRNPAAILAAGTTGLRVLEGLLTRASELTDQPLLFVGIDADLAALAKLASFPTHNLWVYPLNLVDLPRMVRKPDLHPEVAESLQGVKPSAFQFLDHGSQKAFPFTVAAFQAHWARHDGLLPLLEGVARKLQAWQREYGGRKIIITVVGLMCGGVGGVLPLLLGLALRDIAQKNKAFGNNLELNLLWIEPWPEEKDPRLLANAQNALSLLEAAHHGRLKLIIRENGVERALSYAEPLFNNVFVASEITENGRLTPEEFHEGLGEFLLLWTMDPLSEEARARLTDVLSVREKEVANHARVIQSFGVSGFRLDPDLDYAKAAYIFALRDALARPSSLPQEEIERIAESFLASQGLFALSLRQFLSRNRFGHPHIPVEELRPRLEQEALTRAREGLEIKAWLENDVIRKVLNHAEESIKSRVEEKSQEAKKAVEGLLEARLAELDLNGAIQLLSVLTQRVQALQKEVQATSQAKEIHQAIWNLERARLSFFLKGRKLQRQAANLAKAVLDHLDERLSELYRNHIVRFYSDFADWLKRKEREIQFLQQTFQKCIAMAKERIESSPPFREAKPLKAIEPIFDRAEYFQLLAEHVGCSPLELSPGFLTALARELRLWDDPLLPSEELWARLENFLEPRLAEFGRFDLVRYVRWKAQKENTPEAQVKEEILASIQGRAGVWLTLNRAEFPTGEDVREINILAAPSGLSWELPAEHALRVFSSPRKILLFKLLVGVHKASLSFWREGIPEPQDGKGPIVPSTLKA
jgi:hypothetical protein